MRSKIVMAAIVLLSCFGYRADSQVSVHFNVGTQPMWGPTGYSYARYYYIPDIDAYYDVNAQTYTYLQDGQWITTTYLPPAYADVDLYRVHKVVINADRPWLRDDFYRNRYYSYRGRYDQHVIRDSRDHRYWGNPEHPRHDQWHGEGWGQERHGEWGGYRRHEEHEEHEHDRR